jgi:uncharacterized protein
MNARAGLRQIFVSSEGLRAGWGLLVYCCVSVMVAFVIMFLVAATTHLPNGYGVTYAQQWWDFCRDVLFFKGIVLVAALLATLAMARIEGRAILSFWKVTPNRSIYLFAGGAASGFALFATVIGLIALCHGYTLGVPAMSIKEAIPAGVAWFVGATIYGVGQILILYGYPLFTLRRSIGFPLAGLLTALGFVLFNIVWFDADILGFTAILSQGIFLSLTLRKYWNLSLTAGVYSGIVFAQDFVFSVSDSGTLMPFHLRTSYHFPPNWLDGASAGPKASLMSLIVFSTASAALVVAQRLKAENES